MKPTLHSTENFINSSNIPKADLTNIQSNGKPVHRKMVDEEVWDEEKLEKAAEEFLRKYTSDRGRLEKLGSGDDCLILENAVAYLDRSVTNRTIEGYKTHTKQCEECSSFFDAMDQFEKDHPYDVFFKRARLLPTRLYGEFQEWYQGLQKQ